MAAVEKDTPQDHEADADPGDGAASFDADAVRGALAAGGDLSGSARDLQEKAVRALSGEKDAPVTNEPTSDPTASGPAVAADEAFVHTWSFRRQVLFIGLASAACWAAVLAPILLIF